MKLKNLFSLLFFIIINTMYGQHQTGHTFGSVVSQDLQREKDGISFLAIGDFGRHGAFTQKEVARDMGAVANILDLDFTVAVGDNFYPSGVQSTQDYQWISSFESIYTHHSLHSPWYVALGNHDYEGNIQAQIDYTKVSRRWEMPEPYFEKRIEIKKGKFLQLLIIDTNPFVSKYQQKTAKYLGIDQQDTQKQLAWLESKLKDKNPEIVWRIVVGHHPLYSGGKRKTEQETLEIKDIFEPLFEKYYVDAYICGHEHDLQIIKKNKRKLMQFLSGAGSELRETGKTEGTLFAESVPGFMAFTLTQHSLKAYVIQSEKDSFKVVYKTEIKK
ncbi:metallophosphoesterase [Vaginella massiliensis]|uniref:metallophosphoesterase n=1 Tax=Vaginella massiliensis TaxID=1816680 RepID=UPI0037516AFE